MMKDIGVLFLSMPVVIFFIWCIVIGLCTALIWNFLFWHLENLADDGYDVFKCSYGIILTILLQFP